MHVCNAYYCLISPVFLNGADIYVTVLYPFKIILKNTFQHFTFLERPGVCFECCLPIVL
jgi:hypothetical protein